MDAEQSSGRKRKLTVDDEEEGDNAKTQCFERPEEKRACRVIKDEPDDEEDGMKLLSLPARPRDQSPVKKEEDDDDSSSESSSSGASRGSLLTPPSSPHHPSPPSPSRPRYWHPAFPNRAVRCGRCGQTDTVDRVRVLPCNRFNAGRLRFTCIECGPWNNRFGSFICWADTGGIYENNMTCDCGLPVRADLTTQATPGRLFFNCAMGQCRFFEWTDEVLADRADLEHRVHIWVSDIEGGLPALIATCA
ncbi:hypothetical protein PG991_004753 [Apiospora marii]|uniref:GRF-type domain-containing protein n=1 Tax=Apiospora marii TaxID=335849 RepID=A0ABR1S763_9PEZI